MIQDQECKILKPIDNKIYTTNDAIHFNIYATLISTDNIITSLTICDIEKLIDQKNIMIKRN